MKIIHVYDGHERVYPGEGSVPSVVYEIAKYTSEKGGHDVTIFERRWEGTEYKEEIDGIKFERVDVKISSNVSNEEIVAREIKRPSGLLKLILDRTIFALKANEWLKENNFDVIHVHLPFAANLLVNINRDLRRKIIYTAHIGEERKRFALDSSAPLALKFFSPDLYLMKRVKKSVVLNEPLKEKLVEKGIKEDKLEVIANGVNVDEFDISEDEIKKVREKYELNETTVMFAGTITPRKGVEYLIKAAEILKEDNVLFLIVGNTRIDRQYAERVMSYARKKDVKA